MKIIPLKNLLLHNAPLKIICLILGYSFWYIATVDHVINITLSIPLYFSTEKNNYPITAPETVNVTLQGRRKDLYTLEKNFLAAHINIDKLSPGKHGIILHMHHLFLPETIQLMHYTPSNLTITIHDTSQETLV